jgi:hypothetical protein
MLPLFVRWKPIWYRSRNITWLSCKIHSCKSTLLGPLGNCIGELHETAIDTYLISRNLSNLTVFHFILYVCRGTWTKTSTSSTRSTRGNGSTSTGRQSLEYYWKPAIRLVDHALEFLSSSFMVSWVSSVESSECCFSANFDCKSFMSIECVL